MKKRINAIKKWCEANVLLLQLIYGSIIETLYQVKFRLITIKVCYDTIINVQCRCRVFISIGNFLNADMISMNNCWWVFVTWSSNLFKLRLAKSLQIVQKNQKKNIFEIVSGFRFVHMYCDKVIFFKLCIKIHVSNLSQLILKQCW